MRSNPSVVALAEVTGGLLKLADRVRFQQQLSRMRDGQVQVRVEYLQVARSVEANRYWWGVCIQLVSEHTGYDPEEVHALAKQLFLPRLLSVQAGNGTLVGDVVIGGSTTRLDGKAFWEFVERFRRWAAETLDVVIPDPDPAWREASHAR